MPIFADSEVIPVRFSRPELDRLRAAAAPLMVGRPREPARRP